MKELASYRSRYDEFRERNAHIVAVSTDRKATASLFKSTLRAPYAFVADRDHALTKLFGAETKKLAMTFAKRLTFVIGEGRKILHVESGLTALNPDGALAACPIVPPS